MDAQEKLATSTGHTRHLTKTNKAKTQQRKPKILATQTQTNNSWVYPDARE